MGNAVRLGDTGTDHDGFPPTPTTAGSGTVKIDGIPVCRLGDPLASHDKPKPPHMVAVLQQDQRRFLLMASPLPDRATR